MGATAPSPIYQPPPYAAGGVGAYVDSSSSGEDGFIMIIKPVPIELTTSIVPESDCGLCDGEVTVNVDCGIPPYDYYWSTGDSILSVEDTVASLSNLCPGNYSVIVKSSCNVFDTAYFVIQGQVAFTSVNILSDNQYCNGAASDTLVADMAGGIWSGEGVTDSIVGIIDPMMINGGAWVYYEITTPCPAIDSIFVTVLPPNTNFFTQDICPDDSVIVNGAVYSSLNPTGSEIFPGADINGCDSIVNIHLTPFVIDTALINLSICVGDSIVVNGTAYNFVNPTGVETITSGNVHGCDSVILVDLDFLPQNTISFTQNICINDSVIVNGTVYSSLNPMGSEIFLGADVNGCDSIVNIHLTPFVFDTTLINPSICMEDSIVVNGTTYNFSNSSGVETITSGNVHGCDSVILINLDFLPQNTTSFIQNICVNDSVIVNGTVYSSLNPTGSEIFPGTDVNGCDSIVNIHLTPFVFDTTLINPSICMEDSIVVNGTTYNFSNSSGIETITSGNVHGCDSVILINLDFLLPDTLYFTQSICPNDSIIFNGTIYNVNNLTGIEHVASSVGCDSVVVIDLQVQSWMNLISDVTTQDVSCQNLCDGLISGTSPLAVSYSMNGGAFQNSSFFEQLCPGTYNIQVASESGCIDSTLVNILDGNEIILDLFTSNIDGCLPLSIDFNVLNMPAEANYVWSFGDGNTSFQQNPNHIYTISDCYEVTLAVDVEGCIIEDTLSDSICVWNYPIVDFEFSPDFISNLNNNTVVDFMNYTINGWDFEWVFETPNGESASSAMNPIFDYSNFPEGKYRICLTALTEQGCHADTCKFIEIKEDYLVYVPNSFTPDGDEFNNAFLPVFSDLRKVTDYQLLIFNRWGQLIFESHAPGVGWDGTYNAQMAQDGVYTWKLNAKFGVGVNKAYSGSVSLIR